MELKLKRVIARHLKSRGLSLNSLAKQSGISSSTIHNWLHATSPTVGSLEKLLRLANYLNLSITELLLDKTEKNSENEILFQSTFKDDNHQYRLTIEKLTTKKLKK